MRSALNATKRFTRFRRIGRVSRSSPLCIDLPGASPGTAERPRAPEFVLPDELAPRVEAEAVIALARPPTTILLVEDNPGDVRLVREVLGHSPIPVQLAVANDGLLALEMLQSATRKPDLILLDLNLLGLDGRSLLKRIKTDPGLWCIPVVIVSGSDASQDVLGAYDLHANCYLVKSPDLAAYERSLQRLVEFWIGIVRLAGG